MVLLLVAVGYTDRLILFPSTDPIGTTGLDRREVPLSGGGAVEVWVARSPGASRPVDPGRQAGEPVAYVLAFIGNAARAELTAAFHARDWGGRPVEVWAVNYPGYGGSPGPARLKSIGPAALAAYDALRRHAGDKPIIVEGRSLGTTAALHVAAHRPVAGCVLHNPPPLRQLIWGRHGWWNLWLVAGPVGLSVPADLDSLANARRATAPAVFLLAGADEVVPPAYQAMVAGAYAGEKRVVRDPRATHNDRVGGPAAAEAEAALDWLWERAGR